MFKFNIIFIFMGRLVRVGEFLVVGIRVGERDLVV